MRRLISILIPLVLIAFLADSSPLVGRRIATPATVTSSGGGDPDFASVVLLLHMNGTDGSTTFTDNSPSPRTITAFGDAQIDTAQSVFGGASGLFDGNGDYLSTTTIGIGANDFTIECRARVNSEINNVIFGCRPTVNARGILLTAEGNKFKLYAGDSAFGAWEVQITGTTTISTGTWYAVCAERSGSTWRLYVNGAVEASTTASFTVDDTANFTIAEIDGTASASWDGWIDEFRATLVARYSGNYTVATEEFPDN